MLADRDRYRLEDISYFCGFHAESGFLQSLPNLKAVISLGAGVDGFLRDSGFPRTIPLVRFVDPTLIREVAQYVTMHVLIAHRGQRFFDAAQRQRRWRQCMLARRTGETHIGILGLGNIGTAIAQRLTPFGFQLSGWSVSRKYLPRIKSYVGDSELSAFLSQCDFCVCVLPLTEKTRGILNVRLFSQLPLGATVINVGRGGHLVEQDLIAALDLGHLGGAVLDVFAHEPLPPDSPIWRHPKITVTPHIAALIDTDAALDFIGDCVARVENARPLLHVVDLARRY